MLNYNDGMQNKKGRTITFRVDDEVAEKFKGTQKCVMRACPEFFVIGVIQVVFVWNWLSR